MNPMAIRFDFFLLGAFSLFFGACVGSFLNVCIYRIPRDESVVTPRSHCPHCNTLIPWFLNIPVFSWLALRGHCATCKGSISFRYTLVELLTAGLFLLTYLKWTIPDALHLLPLSHPLLIPVYWLALAGFILGTFVDFEHYILPDSVTIGGMLLGPIISMAVPVLHGCETWHQGLLASGLGLAAGFGSLFLIAWLGEKAFKKEAMGFGDVKLMGAIGAFFGWQAVLFTLLFSSFIGSLVGLVLILFRQAKMQSCIPFGPYLAAGAMVWMFYGPALVTAYFQLMSK